MNNRWKPHFNERYYSVGNGGVLEPGTWMNDFVDIALYKLGNCYATPEEAEVNVDKWVKWYNSKEEYDNKKTCPFCGERAIMTGERVRLGSYTTGCMKLKVICTGCGCSVSFPGGTETTRVSFEEATRNTVNKWNNRF